MVLNTLLTIAEAGIYALSINTGQVGHTVGIYKVSSNAFYLFDANWGLFFGTRMELHTHLYTDPIFSQYQFFTSDTRAEAIQLELESQARLRSQR
jgi:hypothetical protein